MYSVISLFPNVHSIPANCIVLLNYILVSKSAHQEHCSLSDIHIIFMMLTRAYKNGGYRVRACNSVNLKPGGIIELLLKIVTHMRSSA